MIVRYYFDTKRQRLLEFIVYAGTQSKTILMGFAPMSELEIKNLIEETKYSLEVNYLEDYVLELALCNYVRGYLKNFGDSAIEKIHEEELNYLEIEDFMDLNHIHWIHSIYHYL